MDYNDLKERIKKHEGFVNKIYKDSLGFATIGYGHLVTKEDSYEEGVEYTEEELSKVFDQDFIIAGHGAETLMNNNEVYEIDHEAKCVLIEMVFQLGIGGVGKFKKMWAALKNKDYGEASFQMMDSRWAKQTPSRAKELSSIMRSCKA